MSVEAVVCVPLCVRLCVVCAVCVQVCLCRVLYICCVEDSHLEVVLELALALHHMFDLLTSDVGEL